MERFLIGVGAVLIVLVVAIARGVKRIENDKHHRH